MIIFPELLYCFVIALLVGWLEGYLPMTLSISKLSGHIEARRS